MGRRWGKSTLGNNIIVPIAVERGLPFGWFAPTYLLLDEAYRTLRHMFQPIVSRSVSSPAPKIELMTGGVIDFWTMDDPKTVARGRKYAGVAIDEAAMARYLEEAWQQAIRPTLTDYKGDAWFFSTPKGANYFKQLFDDAATLKDWARWQMPTTANPYIDPTEVEAARLSLPSLVFRQEYLAEFVDAEGAAVSRSWLKYGEPVDESACTTVMGVDLAISTKTTADWTAAAVLSRDAEGRVYLRDVQRVRAPFAQVLQFIEGMAAKWKPSVIAIEQVSYQAAVVQELLRKTTLPVRGIKPDADKLTRFQPLVARYEQGYIYHSHDLPRLFEDELLSFPVGVHDDMVDAMAYAFAQLHQPRPKLSAL
jgi:predicted phage terminase large subunit-like protein